MASEVVPFSAIRNIDTPVSNEVAGDVNRSWESGGLKFSAIRNIDTPVSNEVAGDVNRSWGPGGLKFSATRNIDTPVSNEKAGDVNRSWEPGGLKFSATRNIDTPVSNEKAGDILKVCFVTLDAMTDKNAIVLTVEQPNGIPWMQEDVITSAWCWKITRADGVVMGFTSHDEDIDYGGTVYKASTGFAPTAVSTSDDMGVDNLDAEGMISDESITIEDLTLGKYNDAQIEVFLINYSNLKDPIFMLRRGTIGEVTYGNNKFTAEIRGLMERFSQKSGKVTSKQCRTHLGTTLCKINLRAFTEEGSVTAINEDGYFYISNRQADNYFSYGLLTWTSGLNAGEKMEVKEYKANGLTKLFLPMPYGVKIGDTFQIVAGCDGNPTTCRNRFNNLVNFRGEPYTPGNNYVQNYPNSGAGNITPEGTNPRRVTYIWG